MLDISPKHSDCACNIYCAPILMLLTNVMVTHSIGMCRMRWFLAILRSFFHSSLSYTFSCHSSPPTMLPSSLTSSCHLFLGLPLDLVVSKFIHNTFLGILFSSILCTCPNQRNICNLIVSVIVGFFYHCINFFVILVFGILRVNDVRGTLRTG